MSKTKKGLLAGITILLIGAVIFVVSFAVLGWDIYALDSAEYVQKSYEHSEDAEAVKKVYLSVDTFKIEVSAGDRLALDYYEPTDSPVTVSEQDGVFSVEEDRKFGCASFGMFDGFKRMKYKYTLTVPEGVDLEIDNSNGDVTVTGLKLGNVKVRSSNCDFTLEGCTADEMDFDASNGDLKIRSSRIAKLKAEASNFEISVKNSVCGEMTVKGSNLGAVIADTESASVSVHGSNADVEIINLTVNSLTVTGSNLDADISIKGERKKYTVIANGKGMPASQTGTDPDKKIVLSGSNADVDLRFVS